MQSRLERAAAQVAGDDGERAQPRVGQPLLARQVPPALGAVEVPVTVVLATLALSLTL